MSKKSIQISISRCRYRFLLIAVFIPYISATTQYPIPEPWFIIMYPTCIIDEMGLSIPTAPTLNMAQYEPVSRCCVRCPELNSYMVFEPCP